MLNNVCYVELSNCPFYFVEIERPSRQIYIYAFVINNQVLLYLYETIVASVQRRDNKSFLMC